MLTLTGSSGPGGNLANTRSQCQWSNSRYLGSCGLLTGSVRYPAYLFTVTVVCVHRTSSVASAQPTMQEGHSNSTVGVGHRHFLVVLASSKQLLPRVNTLHLFLATNGSHDGLVQTERKLRLSVDGLMTASVLHLGSCAKTMVMFAITLLCYSLLFLCWFQMHTVASEPTCADAQIPPVPMPRWSLAAGPPLL